jgi:hypothetical protein
MARQPDMQERRPNPGRLTESEILNDTNPTQASNEEVYQSESAGGFLPVRVVGPVMTRDLPTVSAGSRQENISATARAHRVASADPRRASVTIVCTQPTYISTSRAQVELGTCALAPANVGLVFPHGQEIWIGGPATNTFPYGVAVWVENWAH